MKKYVLFGGGEFSKNVIGFIGAENILCVIDNDTEKSGMNVCGVPVYSFEIKKNEISKYEIIISVSKKYENEIVRQLEENGLNNYKRFNQIKMELTRKKIQERTDYIGVYNKAIKWIMNNNIKGESIICNTDKRLGYPEVTGYYIPTLIKWGYKELALSFAEWLINIQRDDGSWLDTDGKDAYIFDSAQILKGLVAIREIYPNIALIDNALDKGCGWILKQMDENGRLVTPSKEAWGRDETVCSEIIHIYCLSPIIDVGNILHKSEYINAVKKIWNYYKTHYYEKIMNFSLLSHFYAYLMEALVDLGEIDMAHEAMKKMERYQKQNGAIPAYNNVDWVCSTGMFQLALVWYRLGDYKKADKTFEYACKLQNESGGWYGSYLSEENPNENNNYFPISEISWANKFFLDALYYKNVEQFNRFSDTF